MIENIGHIIGNILQIDIVEVGVLSVKDLMTTIKIVFLLSISRVEYRKFNQATDDLYQNISKNKSKIHGYCL